MSKFNNRKAQKRVEPINKMNDMIQVMVSMSSQRTIRIKTFGGKQKDYPKWELKQKNNFVMADLGHVLEEHFVGKLPSSKTIELSENTRQNRKRGLNISNRMQK